MKNNAVRFHPEIKQEIEETYLTNIVQCSILTISL